MLTESCCSGPHACFLHFRNLFGGCCRLCSILHYVKHIGSLPMMLSCNLELYLTSEIMLPCQYSLTAYTRTLGLYHSFTVFVVTPFQIVRVFAFLGTHFFILCIYCMSIVKSNVSKKIKMSYHLDRREYLVVRFAVC